MSVGSAIQYASPMVLASSSTRPAFCAQHFDHFGLLEGDLLPAPVAHVAEAQALARRVVELAEQLALPAVPGARPHRANVDCGQDGKVAQALLALHLADEILDRLGVGEVALLRRVAHQQMVEHEPSNEVGLAARSGRSAGTTPRLPLPRAPNGRPRAPWQYRAGALRHRRRGASSPCGSVAWLAGGRRRVRPSRSC